MNSELAAAAAWDAVRAADESVEQHRLAAAIGRPDGDRTAPDLVLDALTMFGAIGYTWEHDTHLYWRRAISLAASLGPTTRWSREVGGACPHHEALHGGESRRRRIRIPRLGLGNARPSAGTAQRPPFGRRQGARPGLRRAAGPVGAGRSCRAAVCPRPWGVGASAVQQVIINEEFDKRPGLIKPSLGIAEWILPTILDSGTDAQRERFA